MNTLLASEEALEIIGNHYNLGSVDYCMLIRRSFNDCYLVGVGHQKYVLRVYLDGKYYVESDDAYRFELSLVEHLHAQGVPVANAIPSTTGELLAVGQTRAGLRSFALFHYADGIALSRDFVTTVQSYEMGVALASLHLAANSFKCEFERYKLDLKYLVDEPLRLITAGEQLVEPTEEVKHGRRVVEKLQPIKQYIDCVNSIGTDGDAFGVIHADMHLGNIHFRGNNLTIFDFDHCAYGWRAYDLSVAYGLPLAQRVSMIEGYESKRPLSRAERDSLQSLANLRNLWDIGDILATQNLRAE